MLNDRLREARQRAGITQKDLADRAGIAASTYSGYERGASDPDVNTLCRLMSILGVDANFIYQDYEIKKEAPNVQELQGDIPLEESTRLLVELGYIQDGQQLSDGDLAFLEHIIGLLDAWFSGKDA